MYISLLRTVSYMDVLTPTTDGACIGGHVHVEGSRLQSSSLVLKFRHQRCPNRMSRHSEVPPSPRDRQKGGKSDRSWACPRKRASGSAQRACETLAGAYGTWQAW